MGAVNEVGSDAMPPGDGGTDGGPDAMSGGTCFSFGQCAGSCMDGPGFGDCLMNCAANIRPASRPLVDSLLTCVRGNCMAGLNVACAGMAVMGPCATQLSMCSADGAPPDGGMPGDVPGDMAPGDVPGDMAPPGDAPADMVIPVDVPVDAPLTGYGCREAAEACVPSCPERDVMCIRQCSSGMRAASIPVYQRLVDCIYGGVMAMGVCVGHQSFGCGRAMAESACMAEINLCNADMGGTFTPPCPMQWESRCGGSCVNTSFGNNSHCGQCGNACAAGEACAFGHCVRQGHTSIALEWESVNDVDLLVRTPCGDTVGVMNPTACGATFGTSVSGIGVESVSFASAPMAGRYIVCAVPREMLRGSMVSARVLLNRSGMPLQIFPPSTSGSFLDRRTYTGAMLSTVISATTQDCTDTSPYRIADFTL